MIEQIIEEGGTFLDLESPGSIAQITRITDSDKRISLKEAYGYSKGMVNGLLQKEHGVIGRAVNHLAEAQGKGVRAVLLLQCAVGRDGMVPAHACKAAAAVELFHLATLVHDDIIDDAKTRRGILSVQEKFGKKQAVIVGDYLLSLSLSTLASINRDCITEEHLDILSRFFSMVGKVCAGEYRQLANSYNTEIGFREYYKTISGKTAALFWMSSYMGAALGGETGVQTKKIARFGQLVGLVFQILDDCKDYEMSESEALKPVKSDLKEGVVTLPLILAMAKDKELREDVKKVFAGSLDVAVLVEKVRSNDGVTEARGLSKKFYKKASTILNDLENEVKKSILRESLDMIFPNLAIT